MDKTQHLIPDTTTLQLFVRVNVSVLKDSFLPFELDAQEKYLRPYLGETLLKELLRFVIDQGGDGEDVPEWANSDEKKSIFKEVLRLSRNSLAKFTLFLASPHMDLHLSEMGFVVAEVPGSAPASAERVRKLVEAYHTQGYDNLETLLRYLEQHHKDIDSYKDSDAFVLANGNLINSAEAFDRIVSINGSRRRFIALKPEIDNTERLVIEPVISVAMADKLRKGLREKNLSPENKRLLDLLQRAIANLVMADDLNLDDVSDVRIRKGSVSAPVLEPDTEALFQKKERLRGIGNNYLAWAKRLLDKDPDKYPEYKTSEQYLPNRTYSMYQNTEDEDNRLFIFGQP